MFLHEIKGEPDGTADEQDAKCSFPPMPSNHPEDAQNNFLESETITSFQSVKSEDVDLDYIKEEIQESLHEEDELGADAPSSMMEVNESGSMPIDEFVSLVQKYERMSRRIKKLPQFRSIRLVECPVCIREFKNSPDRLLRLFHHVNKQHHQNKIRVLKQILRDYYPLIVFMRTELKSLSTKEYAYPLFSHNL